MNGTKKTWDEQGTLLEEATYVLGKLEGRFFQLMPDRGEIVYTYHNHFKNGEHEIYYPPNEQGQKVKALSATFKDDLLSGIATEYTPKGHKVSETPYENGVKSGIAKIFATDGKVASTITFVEDTENGPLCQYFPNGKVWRETQFVNGVRSGSETTYHENGNVTSKYLYQNDLLEGLCQNWNEKGTLIFEAEYSEGKRHGKFNKYYENGLPLLEQEFAFDEPIGEKKRFDQNGEMTVSR